MSLDSSSTVCTLAWLTAMLTASSCTNPSDSGPAEQSGASESSSGQGSTSTGVESGDGTDGSPYEPPADAWIDSDRTYLVDGAGRPRLFRGVNARIEGIFDVTFDDGRERLEPIPTFGPEDAAQMRALGFNVLRLPINWSGVEPQRDQFDEDYLDAVEVIVELCKAEEIYVMIDFHQDAYSKEIGEDGAPLWAIVPPPEDDELMEGPLTVEELEAARTSLPVLRAFQSFFADDDDDPVDQELQAEFAQMAQHVASRFANEPWVIGYEMFNEPVAEDFYLERFHTALAAAIREVDDRHLLFFEPNAIRNFTDSAPPATASFADARGVYAPHLYTLIFSGSEEELATLNKERLRANFDNAVSEAKSWSTPLFIGEWGIGPEMTNAEAYTRYMYELLDENFLSSTTWVWKENAQGFWGFYDFDASTGSWTERAQVHRWHDRPYAVAVGGSPTSMQYALETETFTLEFEGRVDGAPSEIYVPEHLADGMRVTCDGAPIDVIRDGDSGIAKVFCGSMGSHRVSVTH